jgi:hypothetical protein
MQLTEYEGAIADEVETQADITRSDAQGIVEANNFVVMQSWTAGISARTAASVILLKN